MKIPQHVYDLMALGHPQKITERLSANGDKCLLFDGEKFAVSGYQGDRFFEREFGDLEEAIAFYESVKI